MIIRKADLNDIDNLVKVRLSYLEEDFGLSGEERAKLVEQLPDYFRSHIGGDFIAYIAEEEDEFVSSVFLVVIEKPANPHMLTGKIGNILNVYTKPEFRRKGLAGQLLKMAIEDAENMELSNMELSASKMGFPLYKSLGFEEVKSDYAPMKLYLKNK